MSGFIPAGTTITISTGSYSDYTVMGVFETLRDIHIDTVRSAWYDLHPEQKKPYEFRAPDFIAWLAREGYIKDIPSMELSLGDMDLHEACVME